MLTQLVSASVLFVSATAFGSSDVGTSLASVGQISEALIPHLGATAGRLVFSLGVLGASIVAAIVCSLALAWALSEAAGHRRLAELSRSADRCSMASTPCACSEEVHSSGRYQTCSG